MFADKLFNLPYSEYWLPLAIGSGVGLMAVVALRSTIFRKPAAGPLPPPPPKKVDYDPFVQGSVSEQRKAPRRGGNPVQVQCALKEDRRQNFPAWVRDRSTGGLSLLANQEVAKGAILMILPENAPDMTPWVEVEVRMVRQLQDDEWELGCQFLRTPPWSILLLFG